MSISKRQLQNRIKKIDVSIINETFEALKPRGDEFVETFYNTLFERYPDAQGLFTDMQMEKHIPKMLSALSLVVDGLSGDDFPLEALQGLGERHVGYGATEELYGPVAETMLDVLAEFCGEAWNDEVKAAWSGVLGLVADAMLSTENSNEEKAAMATTNKERSQGSDMNMGETATSNLHTLMDILEYAPLNIMIADADENVIFVNKKARDILTDVEDELAQYLPGFKVSEVVGGSIHRYHKNPAAIKSILQNLQVGDKREGEITPGPFIFEHETRRLVDQEGNHLGFVVQWADVTAQREKEDQAERLQKAIDGAQTAIMMIDRDLNVTYANESTMTILSKYEDTLRSLFPGFSADKVVGSCIDMFHKNPAHQRGLLSNPANLPYETDIEVGPLTFNIRVNGIHNLQGEYVGNVLEWADVTELRASEVEVARLQSAIKGAQTALMMCDNDLNITYVNPAVVELLRYRQDKLRKFFPGFNADNLVGQNIDQFHKNPGHQRAVLGDKNNLPAKAEIKLLDLEFEVNATAILGPDGELMGNMVEWKDITEQKDAERQIESLIDSAIAGQLEQRIDTAQYSGFMETLGTGINSLMDAVVEPVNETTRVVQALAKGDLKEQMEGQFDGQFGDLSGAVNTSITNLSDMVAKILESATSINTAAAEIAQGNTDLSQRTEEQASSLEETASSMEELTSTVKQNADNAKQANQLAAGARTQAEKGGEVVGNAITAMSAINSSSKKISDIIGVIDEIAFQTNLLALNAAVEAARAGEQGRGFAVVAAEVRNLAQRSAGAAKEIKSLIKDSVEKVEDGSKLVDESGQTLEEIVNAVKKVSDIIAEIAAASQEQSAGIEQVNKAITQMDEVTQQNAALVEEAAAASESLDEQARGLTGLMDFFDTDGQPAASAGGAAPARAAASAPKAPAKKAAAAAPKKSRAAAPAPAGDDEWEEF